jgi:hypothetical protein
VIARETVPVTGGGLDMALLDAAELDKIARWLGRARPGPTTALHIGHSRHLAEAELWLEGLDAAALPVPTCEDPSAWPHRAATHILASPPAGDGRRHVLRACYLAKLAKVDTGLKPDARNVEFTFGDEGKPCHVRIGETFHAAVMPVTGC